MLGHLVPCHGGKPLPLRKRRAFIGRRTGTNTSKKDDAPQCELKFVDGSWQIAVVSSGGRLEINGKKRKSGTLQSGDILTLGQRRYRLVCHDAEAEKREPIRRKLVLDSNALGHLIPRMGGPVIAIRKPRVTVGRKDTCDITLPVSTVSSLHCGLELVDGHWRVTDLGSQNGIKVGGIQYQKKWLFPGDILTIATVRYEIQYTPRGDAPPAEDVETILDRSLMDKAGITDADVFKDDKPADTRMAADARFPIGKSEAPQSEEKTSKF